MLLKHFSFISKPVGRYEIGSEQLILFIREKDLVCFWKILLQMFVILYLMLRNLLEKQKVFTNIMKYLTNFPKNIIILSKYK
jgi:hypothetical protein